MKRLALVFLMLVVGAFVFAGCGGDDDGGGEGNDSVDLTQSKDITIAVITHGEGDSFWAVAKKGAEQAGKDLGVTVKYSESNNDPQEQAQLIDSAVTEEVDGIAVSAPDPDAIRDSVKTAIDAGIPVITLNSGAEESASLGATTHVGQTETIAGEGAGAKLKEAGASKIICIIHEQGNVGLNQRCEGAKKGFGGEVENLQVAGISDVSTTLTEIQSKLEADTSIDGVLSLNPDIAIAARDAVAGAGSEAKVGTFDLSGDVIKAIQDDEILFAVDQQQYLQGYLPVVFLMLDKTNLNTVGGGRAVLTGPGFVTKDNAAEIEKLAEAGTR
ncbi:MAG TPA: sugar ABC transporter substrate-binding protein [Solirubrobacteraceae bacterium]|jgi:simple sugar transport system substrate-binding protein|nr:sugar ABC transporter substrate-binding protein [Solirubrobacteraceae bacterium]